MESSEEVGRLNKEVDLRQKSRVLLDHFSSYPDDVILTIE